MSVTESLTLFFLWIIDMLCSFNLWNVLSLKVTTLFLFYILKSSVSQDYSVFFCTIVFLFSEASCLCYYFIADLVWNRELTKWVSLNSSSCYLSYGVSTVQAHLSSKLHKRKSFSSWKSTWNIQSSSSLGLITRPVSATYNHRRPWTSLVSLTQSQSWTSSATNHQKKPEAFRVLLSLTWPCLKDSLLSPLSLHCQG